ncbi:hypothetical protein SmaMPs15_000051 [Stenotrophomonas maltophilia phage vB_SmaM_Ps15]|uniref:Transmembrane protein n=1 Tax=Stenotrophomonas maltophilia phage vB_SmaM_Ps15 TaxID=3071007 RepID=A0AAE9FNY4_9CAUD|nr:hypothetical protein PQC01_gp051 [Stenotrophomonas maltophilia phage vB_SmaM_Ps15]UMO77202.1 hypothetical protein SmaMPs15_000051 [Stenotrophomonas maltophilia phage vB_SmaM_Ps15]
MKQFLKWFYLETDGGTLTAGLAIGIIAFVVMGMIGLVSWLTVGLWASICLLFVMGLVAAVYFFLERRDK